MSNNTLRIVSSVFMIIIVGICLYFGQTPTLVGIGIVGSLIVDEIITNFYDQKRSSFRYIFSQLIFILNYLFFNFFQSSADSFQVWVYIGLFFDVLMLAYLFVVSKNSETVIDLFRSTSWFAGLIVFIPIFNLSFIVHLANWKSLFVGLILINFMVDTAAYFTGKKLGKHKLWESVSPKKTIEGAIGGVVFSVITAIVFWHYWVADLNLGTILFFILIACSAQIGDLAQSKLKRQFDIKDSSSLIPGHGGVYDRVDSLLFVAPIYAFYLSMKFL